MKQKDFEEETLPSIDFTYSLLLFILFDYVEIDITVALVVGEQLVHLDSRE